jgi:hypothetical protein
MGLHKADLGTYEKSCHSAGCQSKMLEEHLYCDVSIGQEVVVCKHEKNYPSIQTGARLE